MLGIDILHLPWTCAYVNVSYLPTLSTFLIGNYRAGTAVQHIVYEIMRVRPHQNVPHLLRSTVSDPYCSGDRSKNRRDAAALLREKLD